jgi:hypothetical protein
MKNKDKMPAMKAVKIIFVSVWDSSQNIYISFLKEHGAEWKAVSNRGTPNDLHTE